MYCSSLGIVHGEGSFRGFENPVKILRQRMTAGCATLRNDAALLCAASLPKQLHKNTAPESIEVQIGITTHVEDFYVSESHVDVLRQGKGKGWFDIARGEDSIKSTNLLIKKINRSIS